jgi:hypothetical protein
MQCIGFGGQGRQHRLALPPLPGIAVSECLEFPNGFDPLLVDVETFHSSKAQGPHR